MYNEVCFTDNVSLRNAVILLSRNNKSLLHAEISFWCLFNMSVVFSNETKTISLPTIAALSLRTCGELHQVVDLTLLQISLLSF